MQTTNAIEIEIYDHAKKKILNTGTVLFCPDTFIIEESFPWSKEELEAFLWSRIPSFHTYTEEEQILQFLQLTHEKHNFGRMEDARVLYALLHHFANDKDFLKVYPKKNCIFTMVAYDMRFSTFYEWETK